MTQRDSRDHNRIGKGGRNFYSRLRDHRRRKDRRLLTETLEPRQLLAGPDLIGVQPNEGSLINGGEILNVSPREIVFRFDDDTQLDPSTLDGIRISRAGEDGVFESATATSDLGSNGAALVEFRAKATGGLGNGIVVNFVSSSRPGSAIPLVSVNDRVVTINVNSNPSNPTRVQGLISAVANHPTASNLLEVISVSGSTQTPVGTTIANGLSLTLAGANAAEATTDLGTGGNVSVRIVSQLSGADGLGTEIKIERRNFFGPANPLVVVTGQSILVQLNSFSGSPSTLQNFMDAINNNPDAAALVNVFRQGGALTTPIGAGTAAIPTVTLTGVTDVVIEPGFVGLGDSPREVFFGLPSRCQMTCTRSMFWVPVHRHCSIRLAKLSMTASMRPVLSASTWDRKWSPLCQSQSAATAPANWYHRLARLKFTLIVRRRSIWPTSSTPLSISSFSQRTRSATVMT